MLVRANNWVNRPDPVPALMPSPFIRTKPMNDLGADGAPQA
jgi:hypothetical protein